MATSLAASGARLAALWARLARLPGGKRVFSWLLGWMVPYTGSIRPRVVELRPGYAKILMRDRRAVRNHLSSVHAIALANLAEVTSGLAVTTGLPPTARGVLTAEARCDLPDASREADCEFESVISDASGQVVARATVRWHIGPVPPP